MYYNSPWSNLWQSDCSIGISVGLCCFLLTALLTALVLLILLGVNGLRMLGILHDAVVFLIEQLSGAKHCRNYKFRFHKPEEANEPPLNPHGSARAEVHLRQVPFFSVSSFGSRFSYLMTQSSSHIPFEISSVNAIVVYCFIKAFL